MGGLALRPAELLRGTGGGPAISFDGPDSDQVRRYALDNARYWVTEYHLDGLRLDAVHAVVDRSPDALVPFPARRLAAALYRAEIA